MDRKSFLKMGSLTIAAIPFLKVSAMLHLDTTPEKFYFKDDGIIPNNRFPLLVYKNAFSERGTDGANWLEKKFKTNNWYNSWRWGIYPFHHYHSITHEVLGVFQGAAKVQMGGPNGKIMDIAAGDILVIPAGVGHKCISHTDDFTVVGAYPNGMEWDLIKEEKDKHAKSLLNIAKVPLPSSDPLLGAEGGTLTNWKN
ncbi:MAG: cupin [Pseudopedobacter saltans]|uniref:Cupin n=1 Tax=Pseudopedobacter saltans TaxID=151895 RepID=A0A2W5H6D6_9SPHI|nr:MAG: cupin [Pseudopedobacter saltans]